MYKRFLLDLDGGQTLAETSRVEHQAIVDVLLDRVGADTMVVVHYEWCGQDQAGVLLRSARELRSSDVQVVLLTRQGTAGAPPAATFPSVKKRPRLHLCARLTMFLSPWLLAKPSFAHGLAQLKDVIQRIEADVAEALAERNAALERDPKPQCSPVYLVSTRDSFAFRLECVTEPQHYLRSQDWNGREEEVSGSVHAVVNGGALTPGGGPPQGRAFAEAVYMRQQWRFAAGNMPKTAQSAEVGVTTYTGIFTEEELAQLERYADQTEVWSKRWAACTSQRTPPQLIRALQCGGVRGASEGLQVGILAGGMASRRRQ